MFKGDSADTCTSKFPLMLMGGRADGQACLDPGVRTPIELSGIIHLLSFLFSPAVTKIPGGFVIGFRNFAWAPRSALSFILPPIEFNLCCINCPQTLYLDFNQHSSTPSPTIRPSISWKMRDDLNFLTKWRTTSIYLKTGRKPEFLCKMEDDLTFKVRGIRPQC
jgi:hypothetical protein